MIKGIVLAAGYLAIGFVLSFAHYIASALYDRALNKHVDKLGYVPDPGFFDRFIELGEVPILTLLFWPITLLAFACLGILWLCFELNDLLTRVCRSVVDWEFEHERKKNV